MALPTGSKALQLVLRSSQLAPRLTKLDPRLSQRCRFLRGCPSLLGGSLTGSKALRPLWLAFRPLWLSLRPLLLAQRLLQLALIPLWLDLKPHSTGLCTLPGLIAGSYWPSKVFGILGSKISTIGHRVSLTITGQEALIACSEAI